MLAEEHAAFGPAAAYLPARDLRVEPVEEAATLSEAGALALGDLGGTDVVVGEPSPPDGEATGFPAALREAEARAPVLVPTLRGDRASRERALELGAARAMGEEAHAGEIFDATRELGGSLGPIRRAS